ncbi:TetR/AcrR family transcriptional regulator [Myxococcus llanfairpwllgwyngyllgogerychwyrndrobwllllantysiliogogogochensis]|uniref:TetR/AcrR family transcriptional regulator n=1 Tax=Myxococcus llanfairpwllgwyngyllgogerychwyrndrobwllllantysiliogogogochensis TaxID=2590453 RepID=A0A540WR34_9BACT|nr:TetR/AcrR family transcriptional regulator [Myxococcus llanfairpwllgwyngyllgogerychwyrndrobwllllantysiliogogogochensis]TQF11458.1 TetR/AcrR family transcriptional regulator [Myxococcus llanfairpwllgwyngyllgogerychwyrndrobwllllantysiliogogogochensis]
MARPRSGKTPSSPPPEPAAPGVPDARERLIAASSRVLAERGYDATTVKEVARVAGVNQGLVHYYFGSKDALLLAVTREHSQQYAEELRQLREETPLEQLADTSFAWGESHLRESPAQFRLRYELFALGLRNPELTSAVAELQAQGDMEVARTVALYRGGDAAKPEPTDMHYAVIIKACFDALALQALLDPKFDAAPIYALLKRMVLSSVDGPGSAKPARRGTKGQARRGKTPARRRRVPRPPR